VLSRIWTERQAAPQIVQPGTVIALERRGFLLSSMALQCQISLQMSSLRDRARAPERGAARLTVRFIAQDCAIRRKQTLARVTMGCW